MNDGKYDKVLMCNIINHKVNGRTVSLYLPACDEPDMCGSIKYSKALLPSVERIQVFNANVESDGYSLGMNGQWECDNR
jgi:hypothetical protein